MIVWGFLLLLAAAWILQHKNYFNFAPTAAPAGKHPLSVRVDSKRWVIVQFVTTTAQQTPLLFYPQLSQEKVHPGKLSDITFTVENLSDKPFAFRLVPTVWPVGLRNYLVRAHDASLKTITVAAHTKLNLPVGYFVDPLLPKHYFLLTLNYTLFPITPGNIG